MPSPGLPADGPALLVFCEAAPGTSLESRLVRRLCGPKTARNSPKISNVPDSLHFSFNFETNRLFRLFRIEELS